MTPHDQVAAALADGKTLAQIARGMDMSPAMARDLLSSSDQRAVILQALQDGAPMFDAARKVGIKTAAARRVLGVYDRDAPTPDDLRDLILAAFDARGTPAKIAYRFDLTISRIVSVLATHRPIEHASRQMKAGKSPDVIATTTQIAPEKIAEAAALASIARRACQRSGPVVHARIVLRTPDGRTSVCTDPDMIARARTMMRRLAKGRAWTEGAL
jgi:hypothetical protein